MPRRVAQNVSLTPEHAAFIAAQVASGRYAGVSGVVRAALDALARRGERPDGVAAEEDRASGAGPRPSPAGEGRG